MKKIEMSDKEINELKLALKLVIRVDEEIKRIFGDDKFGQKDKEIIEAFIEKLQAVEDGKE